MPKAPIFLLTLLLSSCGFAPSDEEEAQVKQDPAPNQSQPQLLETAVVNQSSSLIPEAQSPRLAAEEIGRAHV